MSPMVELKDPWDNATVRCHIELGRDDLEALRNDLADAYVEVERWDLTVHFAEVREAGGFLQITAFPESKYMLGGEEHAVDGFSPVPVVTLIRATTCAECGASYVASRLHPENGCNFGHVDRVMRS